MASLPEGVSAGGPSAQRPPSIVGPVWDGEDGQSVSVLVTGVPPTLARRVASPWSSCTLPEDQDEGCARDEDDDPTRHAELLTATCPACQGESPEGWLRDVPHSVQSRKVGGPLPAEDHKGLVAPTDGREPPAG